MSRVWPVNTLFQKVGKSGFFQIQLEAIQGHPSSLAINNLNNSFVFPLFLEHLEINEELLEQNRQKTWLCDGHFVPIKHARILLDEDCSQVIFCSLSGCEELKRTSKLFTCCTLRGLLVQMQNICFRSSGMKCSHQDFALGSLRAPSVEK